MQPYKNSNNEQLAEACCESDQMLYASFSYFTVFDGLCNDTVWTIALKGFRGRTAVPTCELCSCRKLVDILPLALSCAAEALTDAPGTRPGPSPDDVRV